MYLTKCRERTGGMYAPTGLGAMARERWGSKTSSKQPAQEAMVGCSWV